MSDLVEIIVQHSQHSTSVAYHGGGKKIYIFNQIYIYIYIYSRRRTRWTWVVVTQSFTRETLSNNNPCPSSPSSTILRSAYMALNTLQQDWLL